MDELTRLLGASLLSQDTTVRTEDAANVEFLLFFFSAHWCGPCRAFKRLLSQFYAAANAERKQVEVVFISSDQDADSFRNYYATMPWLAVDYKEKGLRERLGKEFNVTCIPKLVLLGREGAMRSDSCRGDVENLSVEEVLTLWRGLQP